MLLRLWFAISLSSLTIITSRPSACRADEPAAASEAPVTSEATEQPPPPAAASAPTAEVAPAGEAVPTAPSPAPAPPVLLTPSPQTPAPAPPAIVAPTPSPQAFVPVASAPTVTLVAPAVKTKSTRSPGIRALRWGGVALAALGINMAVGSYSAYLNGEQSHESYTTLRAVNDAGWVLVGVGSLMHVVSWLIRPARDRAPLAPSQTVMHGEAQSPSVSYP